MTRYVVILERGESGWGAYVPDLPGCIAAGQNRDEVLDLIRGAIEFHIEGVKHEGLLISEAVSEFEVVEVGAV